MLLTYVENQKEQELQMMLRLLWAVTLWSLLQSRTDRVFHLYAHWASIQLTMKLLCSQTDITKVEL